MTITFYKYTSSKSSRFYSLHDRQGSLFHEYTFTAVWGSDFCSTREKVYTFDSSKEMQKKLRSIFKRKIKDGFKVLYKFSKREEYNSVFQQLDLGSFDPRSKDSQAI
jgi:hypothetical protein